VSVQKVHGDQDVLTLGPIPNFLEEDENARLMACILILAKVESNAACWRYG
jgi:hypothetical protein